MSAAKVRRCANSCSLKRSFDRWMEACTSRWPVANDRHHIVLMDFQIDDDQAPKLLADADARAGKLLGHQAMIWGEMYVTTRELSEGVDPSIHAMGVRKFIPACI